MSERDQRKKIISVLGRYDAVAVENPCCPGFPDINCTRGNIELKWLRAWPVNADTIVRVDHFTSTQRLWHYRRRRAGGNTWVLLQVRREWLLFDGVIGAMVIGRSTRDELSRTTKMHWAVRLINEELVAAIGRDCGPVIIPPEVFMKSVEG